MIWRTIEFTASLVESLLITDFITEYNGYKHPKYKHIMFSVISVLLLVSTLILNNLSEFEGFMGIIYIVILFICSIIGLNGRISEKLFSSIIAIAFIVLINFATLTSFSIILNNDISDLITDQTIYRIVILFITKFMYYIFSHAILMLKNKTPTNLNGIEWAIVILSFTTSLIISLFLFDTAYKIKLAKSDYYFLSASIFAMIIMNVLSLYLFKLQNLRNLEQVQIAMLRVQTDQQHKSINELKELSLEMKKLKHDISKYFDTTLELISHGKDEKAIKYISEIKSTRFSKPFDMIDTSNDVLNAVLNSKISYCKNNNIQIDYRITGNPNYISDIDISILLGNLLDNAIEAAVKCETPAISVTISEDKAYLIVMVKNTIVDSVLKNNPCLKTTKINKKHHGLGMLTIQDIVNKYNGIFDFEEEENSFIVDVRLKKSKIN